MRNNSPFLYIYIFGGRDGMGIDKPVVASLILCYLCDVRTGRNGLTFPVTAGLYICGGTKEAL